MPRSKKTCPVCGRSFECPPSSKKRTCSKACSSIWKSITHTGKKYKSGKKRLPRQSLENLKLGMKAAQKSPNAGRYPTNVNARMWHVRSPDGVEYRFRNLNLWARQNAHLFGEAPIDAAVNRIRSGFAQIKRSIEGKLGPNQRPTSTYKGWELLDWDETEIERRRKAKNPPP